MQGELPSCMFYFSWGNAMPHESLLMLLFLHPSRPHYHITFLIAREASSYPLEVTPRPRLVVSPSN